MTKKQAIWFLGIGVVCAAVLITGHLMMPVRGSWTLNRILHHAWEGATAAAAIGAVVWLMWPGPKPRRRDALREQARRRFIAVVGTVLAAVILVVFAEIHREMASRNRLGGKAVEDIRAIGRAIEAYAAEHDGKRPEVPADLVPNYLPAGGSTTSIEPVPPRPTRPPTRPARAPSSPLTPSSNSPRLAPAATAHGRPNRDCAPTSVPATPGRRSRWFWRRTAAPTSSVRTRPGPSRGTNRASRCRAPPSLLRCAQKKSAGAESLPDGPGR